MAPDSAKLRILVADDSADVARRVISLLAESLDAELIGPASDGTKALRLFEETAPDVALLDFAMPGMTGLDVLRTIRARGSRCLVMIITAHHDESIERACLAAGADYFLNKLDGLDQIVAILQDYRPTDL